MKTAAIVLFLSLVCVAPFVYFAQESTADSYKRFVQAELESLRDNHAPMIQLHGVPRITSLEKADSLLYSHEAKCDIAARIELGSNPTGRIEFVHVLEDGGWRVMSVSFSTDDGEAHGRFADMQAMHDALKEIAAKYQ